MDELDREILNAYQGGFPLTPRPYAALAERFGRSETEILARIGRLLESGVVSRFGPLYQIERMGGRFVLAAMQVPAHDFARVAAIVNAAPEVAHNYERAHALNIWFVVAVESPDEVPAVLARLSAATGYPVYDFPKEREYFVGAQWTA